MSKTFISYESSDREKAFKVCDYLEQYGIPCWIAPRDIYAGEYAGEITRAINAADNLVVVCSSSTSRSPHVRNEISLAFSAGCKIVPFMLEDVKLDDSIEYYFAGKQRVYAGKDLSDGMDKLCTVLSGTRLVPEKEPTKGNKRNGRILILIAVLVLAAIAFFGIRQNTLDRPDAPQDQAVELEEPVIVTPPEEVAPDSPKTTVIDTDEDVYSGTFSGTISGGYPDGVGKYVFTECRRIDNHDDRAREASVGDYIIGEWDNGHLIQGKWFDADGNVKELIIIGKAPNPEADHILGKCVTD